MPFENIHAAEKFYKEYAHDIGFAVRVGQQRKDNDIVLWKRFMCSRQGFRDKKDNAVNAPPSEGKKKRNFAETRCGCDAYIYVKLDADNRYTIQSMVDEHNHGPRLSSQVMHVAYHGKVSREGWWLFFC